MRTSFRPLPVIALALLTAPLTSGCELFVHFDRSRIGADTATIDGNTNDGGTDAGRDASVDANMPDTAVDAGMDAFVAPDTGVDAGQPDMGTDGGTDANLPDTGMDAGCANPATDCPAPGVCQVAICSGGGCSTTPAATTVHCGTGGSMVCDGAGACVACNVPADCGTSTECAVRTCTTHVCGVNNLGSTHTLTTGQTAGDCQKLVCNGSGGTTSADDVTDVPTASSSCETNPACTGSPLAPSFTPAATGTACTDSGGHVCGDTTMSAAGTCVACNTTADCTAGTCNTSTHTCS